MKTPAIEADPYKSKCHDIRHGKEIPELSNFESWARDILNLHHTTSYLPIGLLLDWDDLYPKCFLDCTHNLAVELCYLLPNTPEVRAILPVLLVGYIMNRRGFEEKGNNSGKNNIRLQGISNLLLNLLIYKDPIQHSNFQKTCKNLFQPSHWKKI